MAERLTAHPLVKQVPLCQAFAMEQRSSLYRALDGLMKGKLAGYVTDRRASGDSWRSIAADLREKTHTDVTHETLRSWFPECVAPLP